MSANMLLSAKQLEKLQERVSLHQTNLGEWANELGVQRFSFTNNGMGVSNGKLGIVYTVGIRITEKTAEQAERFIYRFKNNLFHEVIEEKQDNHMFIATVILTADDNHNWIIG